MISRRANDFGALDERDRRTITSETVRRVAAHEEHGWHGTDLCLRRQGKCLLASVCSAAAVLGFLTLDTKAAQGIAATNEASKTAFAAIPTDTVAPPTTAKAVCTTTAMPPRNRQCALSDVGIRAARLAYDTMQELAEIMRKNTE